MENYKNIQYIIKYTNRKNSIALFFDADFLQVRCPKKTQKKTIEKFLDKYYQDIIKRLDANKFTRQYSQGEEFLIQGKSYYLNIEKTSKNKVMIEDDIINLSLVNQEDSKKLLQNYYKKIAELDVKFLVKKYSKIMDLYPEKVKLNFAKSRWGSCNYTQKTLNFSVRIAMLPQIVQEYIVIHELAHLEHPNHSKQFWDFVKYYMPNYQECEKYLKVNGVFLRF